MMPYTLQRYIHKLLPALDRVLPAFSRDILRRGYTGLEGLDKKLIAAIQPQKCGYFVELGANDGLRQSNTYKLQRSYGWTGLLVEPSPRQFVACIKNRSFGVTPVIKCAACVPFGYTDQFVEMEDADLMGVAKGLWLSDHMVTTHAELGQQFLGDDRLRYQYGALARTLTSLLDDVNAPLDFDLLSLDVEGNEISVLQGLDFARYKPRWILVEVHSNQVEDFLLDVGFQRVAMLSDNGMYRDLLFQQKHATSAK
jgi:FkbM family methyltransferase